MSITEDLVSALVPSSQSCRDKAAELRKAHPSYSNRQLAKRAIATAKKWAAATGGATGVVSNPFAAGGLAAGEMGYILRAEARLIGTISAIYDSEITKNEEAFSADIFAMLFPGAVSEILSQVGIQAGKATTKTLIRKHISKEVLKKVIKFAAKYLGLKVTQRAIITKAVPLVGGIIGATWNWAEVSRVGDRAIKYFESDI